MKREHHPKPMCKILVNGLDIAPKISDRLISLSIDDKRGLESDSLQLELSDHDGLLAIPPLGATIQAWIGWEHTGMVYKGSFTATEVSHSGPPDVLSIRATSADLKKSLKLKKDRSWHNKTIGDIITTIAQEHELKPYISEYSANVGVAHIDQNESDANLITRIASEHNAIATIKNGCLLFFPRGEAVTISGQPIPNYMITRDLGDNHDYSKNNGNDHISGVIAYYYDPNKAERQKVVVGDGKQNPKELRHDYRDETTAYAAAQAEYHRIKASAASLSLQLAYGVPDLIPEMPIETAGFKDEIDNIVWLGVTISHKIDNHGYTTDLKAEVMVPDSDDLVVLADDEQTEYTGVVAYFKDKANTQKVQIGDMKAPKRLAYLYKNETTATNAINREWVEIQAKKGIKVSDKELRKVTKKKAQKKRKTPVKKTKKSSQVEKIRYNISKFIYFHKTYLN